MIFGADRKDGGTVFLGGEELDIENPRQAIARGICLLTEDRKNQGLVLIHSVLENFGLPNLREYSGPVFLDEKRELEQFGKLARELKIKASSPGQDVAKQQPIVRLCRAGL